MLFELLNQAQISHVSDVYKTWALEFKKDKCGFILELAMKQSSSVPCRMQLQDWHKQYQIRKGKGENIKALELVQFITQTAKQVKVDKLDMSLEELILSGKGDGKGQSGNDADVLMTEMNATQDEEQWETATFSTSEGTE